MSPLTYTRAVGSGGKPLAWRPAFLLRRLQEGEQLSLPHSRPMPGIGPRCHELRVVDEDVTWRIIYRTDADAIIIVEVFAKKTQRTPPEVISNCRRRLREYDDA
jgi:phage-related protein